MNQYLSQLESSNKLLFAIPLRPVLGQRFQPTGFPGLGAATYQTGNSLSLLVESAQSMANRLEAVCWNEEAQKPVAELDGISYVRVERKGPDGSCSFLTSSMVEAHRINSPYMLSGSDKSFAEELKSALGGLENGPIDRKKLSETLLKYDIGCLLHGVFIAKSDFAGGRLRISRALSAFIEADGVRQAISGGVKNDHVNPSGDTSTGFGNVPFAREEYTAENITLYVNMDLAQIRGYGVEKRVSDLLILLGLYKIRALLEGNLRLRTACDLEVAEDEVLAKRPVGFALPLMNELIPALKSAIADAADLMKVSRVEFNDELKKGKESKSALSQDGDSGDDEDVDGD